MSLLQSMNSTSRLIMSYGMSMSRVLLVDEGWDCGTGQKGIIARSPCAKELLEWSMWTLCSWSESIIGADEDICVLEREKIFWEARMREKNKLNWKLFKKSSDRLDSPLHFLSINNCCGCICYQTSHNQLMCGLIVLSSVNSISLYFATWFSVLTLQYENWLKVGKWEGHIIMKYYNASLWCSCVRFFWAQFPHVLFIAQNYSFVSLAANENFLEFFVCFVLDLLLPRHRHHLTWSNESSYKTRKDFLLRFCSRKRQTWWFTPL